MCSQSAGTEEEYKEHILACAMRTFQCPNCDFNTSREVNVKRHMKRCHPGLKPHESPIKLGRKEGKAECNFPTEENNVEDWLHQDPGELIGPISESGSTDSDSEEDADQQKELLMGREKSGSDLLEGRLFRKRTMPSLPFAKKRMGQEKSPVPEKKIMVDKSVQAGTTGVQSECSYLKMDGCTQTSPKKHVVVSTTIKKNRQGDADVKVITKERIIFK
jgi:hypothetical protein